MQVHSTRTGRRVVGCWLGLGMLVFLQAGLVSAAPLNRPELVLQTGHTDYVSSVAFSPDSKFVLTGVLHHEMPLSWEVATGKALHSYQGHTDAVTSVAFSPDGKFVLTGSHDSTARLWEAATGAELRSFQGHTRQVLSVTFSPDG